MSAPLLDDLEPFIDYGDSLAAAAGRVAALEAASSSGAAVAGPAALLAADSSQSNSSSSAGLGAYIGCFSASSGWMTGAENATKVGFGAGSRSCATNSVCSRRNMKCMDHVACEIKIIISNNKMHGPRGLRN
jgi:hypothetical protein